MLLIVDANVAPKVLVNKKPSEFTRLHFQIFSLRSVRITIVYGGKLLKEYSKINSVIRALAKLDQSGSACKVNDSKVGKEDEKVKAMGRCKSNDSHVIALARISGARLLCTDDNNLKIDFWNKALIDKPRGNVYSEDVHDSLLKKCDNVKRDRKARRGR